MSVIWKRGDQFLIDGVRRPYLTYTSFCLMGHYQNGARDKARRWLDRLKLMGMDGPRLFGETWRPNPESNFFGNPAWTPYARIIDDAQQSNSSLKLLPRYPVWVEKLAEDLEAREMIAEFCVVATIKHLPHTGMVLNRAAQMFAAMFAPDQSPFLYETINEADAHATIPMEEIARMGYRWHRDEGGDHTNFPGSLIGVSGGGNYEPPFDDSGYSLRNLHLPRGKNWMLGPNEAQEALFRLPREEWARVATAVIVKKYGAASVQSLLGDPRVEAVDLGLFGVGVPIGQWLPKAREAAGRRPLALNETIHFIDKSEWKHWTELEPKWIGLSTQDAVAVLQYHEDCQAAGVSSCIHTRIGMGTNPDEPLSTLERMLVERAGNGGGGIPPPGPGPEPPPDPEPPPEPEPPSGDGFLELLRKILKWLFG